MAAPRRVRVIKVNQTRKPAIGLHRPVHPHVSRHLKIPSHVKLQSFEKTPKGTVLHYRVNNQPRNRLLKPREVNRINEIFKQINANRKGKVSMRTNATGIIAGALTDPHVASKIVGFLLHI